jgi:hypothetical protein
MDRVSQALVIRNRLISIIRPLAKVVAGILWVLGKGER